MVAQFQLSQTGIPSRDPRGLCDHTRRRRRRRLPADDRQAKTTSPRDNNPSKNIRTHAYKIIQGKEECNCIDWQKQAFSVYGGGTIINHEDEESREAFLLVPPAAAAAGSTRQ